MKVEREKVGIGTELRTGTQEGNRNPCKDLNFLGACPTDNGKVRFSVKFITSPPTLQCLSVTPFQRNLTHPLMAHCMNDPNSRSSFHLCPLPCGFAGPPVEAHLSFPTLDPESRPWDISRG